MILKGIKQHVDCPSTIILIKKILGAGYVLNEDLKKHGRKRAKIFKSAIGTPQGIVLSPLFNNIVLHEFDVFVENELKRKFVRGKKRKVNLAYRRLTYKIKNENNQKNKQKLLKQRSTTFSKDPNDPNFFRLHYVRYGDD
jgi:retron-type reverse transcriptase